MLNRAGYWKVLDAESAAQAASILASNSRHMDLSSLNIRVQK